MPSLCDTVYHLSTEGSVPTALSPYPAKLIYLNFHPLEVVARYRDPQILVGENYAYLFNFRPNICNS